MPDSTLSHSLLVFVGGGVGAVLRFWVGQFVQQFDWGRQFPWATFAINAVGSFALGVVATAFAGDERAHWRVLLGTGVCGGFTTFSTFSVETLQMIEQQRWAVAGGYALGSVAMGLFGAWAGWKLARG
ncbi:MAG: fluoride efflux transporter CrcB [Fimbriiglobus sp.]|nr:fluoride efflux transporter CrcB [Fimbriiglobus sp.]